MFHQDEEDDDDEEEMMMCDHMGDLEVRCSSFCRCQMCVLKSSNVQPVISFMNDPH